MLSDRGFFDTARFYPNMNHQKTPKFLSGREQFTEDEVSADRRICKLRYTCEVAFSRVTKTRGLRDVISNDYFPILDGSRDGKFRCSSDEVKVGRFFMTFLEFVAILMAEN